jgi:hypothetical protein
MPKGTDPEDVLDVLLGNITNPSEFVAQVQMLADEYDTDFDKHTGKLQRYYND